MYHSITFGEKNTWDDWHLIPSSRPIFNPPKPKTNYVDIPGANGHLDLSEVVSGEVVYEARTGSLEFIVDNGHKEWHDLYSEIMNYLHGKTMRAVLEDDPTFYYEGRFSVNQWKSEPHNSKITIDYTVNPYKLEQNSSLYDWEWDTFNFETGFIRSYKDLSVNGTLNLTIPGTRMSVTPLFIVSSTDGTGLKVNYQGEEYNLPDGETRVINIRICSGDNLLTFTGNGTLSIDYRGGSL